MAKQISAQTEFYLLYMVIDLIIHIEKFDVGRKYIYDK